MNQFLNIPDYQGAVVYCIENKRNHKKYIGSTMNFKHRIQGHISALKGNYHNSKSLQNDFNNGDFFSVIELYRSKKTIEKDIKNDIRIKEYHSIIDENTVKQGYNNVAFKVFAENHIIPPVISKETIKEYFKHRGGKIREKEMLQIAEACGCDLKISFIDRETGREF